MDIWWLGFLIALVASLAYGYWLGGYAKRRGWTEDYARRRAALVPYCAGAVAVLVLLAVRISTGKGWSAEGSPSPTFAKVNPFSAFDRPQIRVWCTLGPR
jgi:hypothetical protein